MGLAPTIEPIFTYDIDFADNSHGWMLLGGCVDPPSAPTPDRPASPARLNSPQPYPVCQNSIFRTVDGGATWSNPVAVGPVFFGQHGGAVHFLNPQDGFVYNPFGAMITHDGGDHWAEMDLGPNAEFAGRDNVAWALTGGCAAGAPCTDNVRNAASRSTDGGRTWSQVHLFPVVMTRPHMIAFGAGGLLVWYEESGGVGGPQGATVIEITTDGGATWMSTATGCDLNGGVYGPQTEVASADGREIWLRCTLAVQSAPASSARSSVPVFKGLFVSEDGGASWTERSRIDAPFLHKDQAWAYDAPVSFISPARGTALITSWGSSIYKTRDSGVTWEQVGPNVPGCWGFSSLRFDGAGDVWALDTAYRIWASHDVGETWSLLPDPRAHPGPTPICN